jgi:ubiquitin-conjugating enzyme E2 R
MLSDDNPLEWIIHLIGPDDTLYSKGVFRALLRFPANYPFSPPSVQFTSSIIHPNIYNDGKVCITSLQTAVPDNLRTKDSCPKHLNWNPSIGVSGALLGVISLLSEPNGDDPANSEAAVLFKDHPSQFQERCQQCIDKSLAEISEDWIHPNVLLENKKRKEEQIKAALSGGSTKVNDDSEISDVEEYEYVYSNSESDDDDGNDDNDRDDDDE